MMRKRETGRSGTGIAGVAVVGAIALLLGVTGGARADLATHSFSNDDAGTHPNALTVGGGTIEVDLSAIAGRTVYRATLDPGVGFDHIDLSMNALAASTMRLTYEGTDLDLIAPRYGSFDATPAVQAALDGGGTTLVLAVEEDGNGLGGVVSLDVLCDAALPDPIAPVTGAAARFADGDAMITFTEVDPPYASDSVSCTEFYETMQDLDATERIRYRIYRSTSPFTSEEAILGAVLIDEIKPLSGWNPKFLGPGGNCYPSWGGNWVYRLPVEDEVRAAGGTGIYVNRYAGAGTETAYYFVSHTTDGAEDFSAIEEGGNATNGVLESEGTGMVLLDKEEHDPEFHYADSEGQYYYVKWEAPPAANLPSTAYNYLVAVPSDEWAVPEPGVDLKLHCWGGNLNGYYGYWNYFEQGHLLVAGNQFPFEDWWTGYHENLGTLKACDEGTVKPFTIYRLTAFLQDFVAPEYNVDLDRVTLSGTSMGGSGASLLGLRNGQLFSNMISWCGIHIPRESPTFAGSFENAWGPEPWGARFSNVEFAARFGGEVVAPEDGYNVWDYYDNDQWLRSHPDVETPWLTYSNGSNDDGIGWPQAQVHTQALLDTKRPFNFQWGTEGHGQRVALLDPYGYDKTQKSHLLFARNRSVPVFTNGSVDDDFYTDDFGKINAYFSWDPEGIVDEPSRWEISIFVPDAPSDGSYGVVFPESVTADVTPRRLQSFAPRPNVRYRWSLTDENSGAPVGGGLVVVGGDGLLTIPELTFKKSEPRRLIVTHRFQAEPISIVLGRGRPGAPGAIELALRPPNPFHPSAGIHYALPQGAPVELSVYGLLGRRVRLLVRESLPAGEHAVSWDGRDDAGRTLPSGAYFLRIRAGDESMVRKLMLLR